MKTNKLKERRNIKTPTERRKQTGQHSKKRFITSPLLVRIALAGYVVFALALFERSVSDFLSTKSCSILKKKKRERKKRKREKRKRTKRK